MKKARYCLNSRLFNIHNVLVVGRTRFELVTNGLKGQLFLYGSIGCVAATKCATQPLARQCILGAGRCFESQATRRWQQGAVVLDHAHQGADFIGVLFSSSCERFRLAVSFSV